MPIRKRRIASRILAGTFAAAIGGPLVVQMADAAASQSVDVAARPAAAPSMKRATPAHAQLAGLCRDTHKLRMGFASWYAGDAFHRTASGEAFHPNELAAASRILPFNTRIRVTNLWNGLSVVVRINDRGPYVRGRIVDLTAKAAAALGMKRHGTAPVYIEIVGRETQSAATGSGELERR